MSQLSKREGHLVVAAIRVISYRLGKPPRPEDISDLLGIAPAWVRMLAKSLEDEGIIAIVRSAFDEHLEVRDYNKLEGLEEDEVDLDMNKEFADFDRRKAEETERMSNLFGAKDHERRQAEKVSAMEEELRDFKNRKTIDPFGEDAADE